jgi:hypothetical protein
MVAITVVLAAALYVMVMAPNNDPFTNSSVDTCVIKIIWTSGDVSQVIAEAEI